MKSLKLFLTFLTAIALINVSCKKTDIDDSEITYLPNIEVLGSTNVQLECDAVSYTDPGVVATEGGSDVPVTTTITGTYFGGSTVNGPDVYLINYSAINKDGIPGAAMRTVVWPECNGDFVNSIAGMYKATVVRNGVVSPQYTDLKYIIIRDMGNDVYQLSDAIGGYYDFGRGYGYHYAATGMQVIANNIAANDFTHNQTVGVGDFGGVLSITDFSINPVTKMITFTADWDQGFVFEVTLMQVDI
jgi:hypothetical protein